MAADQRARVAVVVNPAREDAADAVVDGLRAHGLDAERVEVDDPGGLVDAVRSAVDDGATIVAPVGGDGTQRAAAIALRGADAALAVVPGGTVNLLGRIVGIETTDDTIAAIVDGDERRFDVGEVDGDVFLLASGTGYDAAVMHEVDDAAKRFGRLGYLTTGLRVMGRSRPRHVRVVADGTEVFAGRAMSVIVQNVAQRGSDDFRIVPDGAPDDGLLDVVVHRCDDLRGLVRAGWRLVRGRRPDERDVVYGRGADVDVDWAVDVWAQIDGDATDRRRRFRHHVEPGALRLRVPGDAGGQAADDS